MPGYEWDPLNEPPAVSSGQAGSRAPRGVDAFVLAQPSLRESEPPVDVRLWRALRRHPATPVLLGLCLLLAGLILHAFNVRSVALVMYVATLLLLGLLMLRSWQGRWQRGLSADETFPPLETQEQGVVPAVSSANVQVDQPLAVRTTSAHVPSRSGPSDVAERLDLLIRAPEGVVEEAGIVSVLAEYFPDSVEGFLLAMLDEGRSLREECTELELLARRALDRQHDAEQQRNVAISRSAEALRLAGSLAKVAFSLLNLTRGENPFRDADAFNRLVDSGEIDPSRVQESCATYLAWELHERLQELWAFAHGPESAQLEEDIPAIEDEDHSADPLQLEHELPGPESDSDVAAERTDS